MRVTKIEIENFRAFYGNHIIKLDNDGKNLMLFGENGSGKSSFYLALKHFFDASAKEIPMDELENIDIHPDKKGTSFIELTLKENKKSSSSTTIRLSATDKKIIGEEKTIVFNANKIKGFFDYKSLLKTYLEHKDKVDLFYILVTNILSNSINRVSNTEFGKEWKNIYNAVYRHRQTPKQKEKVSDLTDKFNLGLKHIINSIESKTNTFIKYFDKNLNVTLSFDKVISRGKSGFLGNNINLEIEFNKRPVPRHQHFLNEARLSALAISLYLASIKANPMDKLKVLVLDDLLVGLDMSNRIPLLKILKDNFVEVKEEERFQIFMTTYDKVWYELVRNFFDDNKWKFVEMYSRKLNDTDIDVPVIINNEDFIAKAKHYLDNHDYKASAVYIRTEFERIVKNICEKKYLKVQYKKNPKELKSDDFWLSIKNNLEIDEDLISKIETYRGVVMNPFSHYDLEKPEFKKELEDTIEAVKELRSCWNDAEKVTIENILKKKEKVIEKLKSEISKKEKVIDNLKKAISKKD